jgi:glutamine synthetase
LCTADANPYLAVACILACGFEGIEKRLTLKMEPAEVVERNEGKTGRAKERRLARNLLEALEEMDKVIIYYYIIFLILVMGVFICC